MKTGLVLLTAAAIGLGPVAAQAEALPQIVAWTAAGGARPPPQSQCPAVANVDLAAIAREDRKAAAQAAKAAAPSDLAAAGAGPAPLVVVPDSARRRPGPDATVIIRTHLPPGGLYNSDLRSVVWREADGSWWFWRQSLNYMDPPPMPPPPPPPPPEGTPEYAAWQKMMETWQPPPPPTDDERWPPVEGRLSAARAAQLEAALKDPCRAWDPDFWPWQVPLKRRVDGARVALCPPDGGAYVAELTEPGRPPRMIGASCINDTPTFRIISAAAYPSATD